MQPSSIPKGLYGTSLLICYRTGWLSPGIWYMLFNLPLFLVGWFFISRRFFLYSLYGVVVVGIASVSLEHVLALFNQRKIVYVVSEKTEDISNSLITELGQGATFIQGRGAYSGRDKLILMAITNNIQLKRIEETVFKLDPEALFIVENTFSVIGAAFGKRKIY